MHRYGTLDVNEWAASAPTINGFKPEPWTLKGVQILECRTEIDDDLVDPLVPPSLHPSIPTYASICISRVPESPVGPFGLAEVRVAARVYGRPVFFLLNAYCDNEAARRELSSRWGFRVEAGEVAIESLHYKATGTVSAGGKKVLELNLSHRTPLPGGMRLGFLPTVNLAHNGADNGKLVLAGLSIEATYAGADSGKQHIDLLDGEAFRCARRFRPTGPMSITVGTADLVLPVIEFVVDPVKPGEESTVYPNL